MKIRRFLLENEIGQQFDMNNYRESCLLTSPTNLGYSFNSDFQQLGNTFIENNRIIEQKNPSGTIYFKSYDKCNEFINFIEKSEKLKWVYIVPFENGDKAYYRDVSIKEFHKTEKKARMLACPVVFNGLSLWYEQNIVTYTIERIESELQWDFVWDSRFSDYSSRSIIINNNGHVEASIKAEILGNVINPGISVYKDGELYASIKIPTVIAEGEKLLYSSRDNEIYVKRQLANGTTENLFKNKYIDLNNKNIFNLPKGSCEVVLTADNNIVNAKLYIYKYFKAV